MITYILNRRLLIVLTFGLFFSFSSMLSQTDPKNLNLSEEIIGLSNKPTSQFAKPALGTSDLYTGLATYQIPFFELKSRDLKLPITLNYASGGIKVSEIGGWLGLSWRLNAGGEILREMKGLPDEMPEKGFFVNGDLANNFESKNNDEKINIIKKTQEDGKSDFEPDVFHYSFGGESGYFVFDHLQNIYLVPHKNWKITKTLDPERKTINSFTVITDNGLKYVFGRDASAIEETKLSTLSLSAYWDFSYSINKLYPTPAVDFSTIKERTEIPDFYSSKWYLIEIESPSTDKITFEYEDAGTVIYVNAPQILADENLTEVLDRREEISCGQYNEYLCEVIRQRPYPIIFKFINTVSLVQDIPVCCRENVFTPFDTPQLPALSAFYLKTPIRYFMHQTRVVSKTRILSKIINSNQDYIIFSHDESNNLPGMCRINLVSLYDRNNSIVRSYSLKYKKVVSNSANPNGTYSDPFSILEYETFKYNIKEVPSNLPANYAQNYIDLINTPQHKDTLKKYVAEGIKSYNYERFFLESVQEISKNGSLPPYTFYYNLPQNIIRRTSVWSGILDYSITNNINPKDQYYFKYLSSNAIQLSDGLYKPIGVAYGQLIKAELPTGGFIEYKYQSTSIPGQNNVLFGNSRVIKIIQNDGLKNTIKRIDYKSIGHSIKYRYSKDIKYYDYSLLFEYKQRISASYPLEECDYTHGVPVGYKEVEVKNCDMSDIECKNANNGYEKFEFTYFDENNKNDIEGLSDVSLFGKTLSYPKYLGLELSCSGDKCQFTPGLSEVFEDNPYLNFSSIDLARGLLKKHSIFKGINLIKETTYNYRINELKKTIGLNGLSYSFGYDPIKTLKNYTAFLSIYSSSSIFLTSTNDKIYDPDLGIKINETFQSFLSNSYNQTKEVSQDQSDGLKINTEYIYPTDISFSEHPASGFEYATTAEQVYNERRNYCNENYSNSEDRLICMNTVLAPRYSPTCYNSATGEFLRQSCIDNFTVTPLDVEANAIKTLVNTNQLNIPIQVVTKKGENIIGASYTSFNVENGIVLPKVSNAIELKDPVSSIGGLSVNFFGQLIKDPRYVPKAFYDSYDNIGNLLQYHEADNINNSFIWGYKKTMPTAKVINAKSNQIAFTSFEDNTDYGNWQLNGGTNTDGNVTMPAKTGNKYLYAYSNNVLQYTFAEAGKYKLEYWSTTPVTFSSNSQLSIRDISTSTPDANGWVLYIKEITVNAPTTLGFGASNAKIDEVRLYPANAQMTTYTYDPLIGMTSETNEKNVTTYYEYDAFGRLSVVRDQDRNIVKSYDYHYKE